MADDRERGAGVIEALAVRPDVEIAIERLVAGDYLADSRILFERKTVSDFAASLVDGRLFHQAVRLANAALPAALVLEGGMAEAAALGVRRESIQGALITLGVFLGIALLRSESPEETARLICYAARQGQALAAGGLPRHSHRPQGKRRLQLYILQGLPGVGPRRAAGLLERFGSVERACAAPASELTEVPGIGDRIARRIRWAVEERTAPYAQGRQVRAKGPGRRSATRWPATPRPAAQGFATGRW